MPEAQIYLPSSFINVSFSENQVQFSFKDDLHKGQNQTIGSLLIAMAATRLSSAGLDFPRDNLAPEPELTLYALLQEERDDAYPYYNALLSSDLAPLRTNPDNVKRWAIRLPDFSGFLSLNQEL